MAYRFSQAAEESARCLQRFQSGVAHQMRERQAFEARSAADDLRRVQACLLYTHIGNAVKAAPDASSASPSTS